MYWEHSHHSHIANRPLKCIPSGKRKYVGKHRPRVVCKGHPTLHLKPDTTLCPRASSVQCLPPEGVHIITTHLFWAQLFGNSTESPNTLPEHLSPLSRMLHWNFPRACQVHRARQSCYCYWITAVRLQVFPPRRLVCNIFIVWEFHPSLSFES